MGLSVEYAAGRTISWGTAEPVDIMYKIKCFLEGLPARELNRLDDELQEKINELWAECDNEPENCEKGLLDDLYDVLEEIAPDRCYFGTVPGDNTHYAFVYEGEWA